MKKKEAISIVEYFYHKQARLEETVRNCTYRYIRRELDELEIFEEIIAKVRLEQFNEVMGDILRILQLSDEIEEY